VVEEIASEVLPKTEWRWSEKMLRLRRVVLDVDKPIKEPSMFALADALDEVEGVAAINMTVNEIDIDVMELMVVIEGDGFDFAGVEKAIYDAGAVLHSVDQIVSGSRLVEMTDTPMS
jgi:hypothetical protein